MLESDDLRLRSQQAVQAWRQDRPALMAVDTETTGLMWQDVPFCVTFAWRKGSRLVSHYVELDKCEDGRAWAQEMIEGTETLVFHNAKFDLQKLTLVDVTHWRDRDPLSVHDTEALAHLLDEHRLKGLKHLARDLLGEETDEAAVLAATRRKLKLRKDDGYHRLPRQVLIPYALTDAEYTLRLWERLYPDVRRWDDLHGLYTQEQALTWVLLDAESRGLAVNLDYVGGTARSLASETLRTEVGLRESAGRDDFNPRSPEQILVAFDKLGIEATATNKQALRGIDHPFVLSLKKLRSDKKLLDYFLAMKNEQVDGVLHPHTRQHGTKTGRMSSGGAED